MTQHIPVLLKPALDWMIPPFSGCVAAEEPYWLVDCTFGGGGHTAAFLAALATGGGTGSEGGQSLLDLRVLAIDQSPEAIARGKLRFAAEIAAGKLELQKGRFGDLGDWIQGRKVLGIFADLGFSSDQLEEAATGLSFLKDGPLDMRLDPLLPKTALDYLEELDEKALATVIGEYGEERFAGLIARKIVYWRSLGELPQTSAALADRIRGAVPKVYRYGRIHPATRTFQALRILVNQEMEQIDLFLQAARSGIADGGRIGVISFHSLEDRKIKHFFKPLTDKYHGLFASLLKKPLGPDEQEERENPRSRSAKLRIYEKIKR